MITKVDASDASNVEHEGARVRDDEAGCAASSIERVLATVEAERRVPLVVGEAGGEGRGHAGDDGLVLGLAIFYACHSGPRVPRSPSWRGSVSRQNQTNLRICR